MATNTLLVDRHGIILHVKQQGIRLKVEMMTIPFSYSVSLFI